MLPELSEELAGYTTPSRGTLQFPVDRPPPEQLVEKLIRVRISQAIPP
ncbi:MAG TPA: hypothetical protein VMV06_05275 [Acidimicrobiales bacterium]|nr:hypothetical protein [Acidimicrobiales bacterium]